MKGPGFAPGPSRFRDGAPAFKQDAAVADISHLRRIVYPSISK
jgi:hypothetical protein